MKYILFSIVLAVAFSCTQTKEQHPNTAKVEEKQDTAILPAVSKPEPPTEALKPVAIPENTDEWTIIPGVQVGKIKADASYQSLVETYGKASIKNGNINLGETSKPATFLYPDTKNELAILWKDETNKKNPLQIIIRNAGDWSTYHGIKIGSTFQEVYEVNVRPFGFVGFEFVHEGVDYSGKVSDWKKGRLSKNMGITFTPSEKGKKSSIYEKYLDNQEFSADDPNLPQLELTVTEMKFTF